MVRRGRQEIRIAVMRRDVKFVAVLIIRVDLEELVSQPPTDYVLLACADHIIHFQ